MATEEAREARERVESTLHRQTRELIERGQRPNGWQAPIGQTPGKVAILDRAALHGDVFQKTERGWELVTRCVGSHAFRGCGAEIRLELEGEYAAHVVDGKQHPAATFEVGMLTPALLRLAQHLLCEECIPKLDRTRTVTQRRDEVKERLQASGMPAGLSVEVSWESVISKGRSDPETEKRVAAIEACKVWASEQKPARGVLLFGPSGSGKTRLAATAAVARMAIEQVTWCSVAVLMANLQAGWNDTDRQKALKVLTGKGPLVLDDLDKLNDRSPAVMSQIFAAIDARDQAGATMIVTTNLSPSELAKSIGDALMSRLAGMCNLRPYPGVDHRIPLEDEAVF
jgi:DNA replication protein DnaC